MGELIKELLDRSVRHDLSKTHEPERAVYDKVVPRLRATTYGGVEHRTLVDVDLLEMLTDWKAATELTTPNGDLADSLTINRERFGITPQLTDIVASTARHFGWLAAEPDRTQCHDTA
ncbi:MAG: hypothetical protein ACJ73S_03405 [Mycobacteriales bacterium]